MNENLINKIENYFNSFPEGIAIKGSSVTNDEIISAEKELNVKFDKDFVNVIRLYNASYIGIELYSVKQEKNLFDNIVNVTKNARISYEDEYRKKILNKGYVIADDGAGNPFVVCENGKVMLFYHDCDEYKDLAVSFSKFLEGAMQGKIDLY